METLSKNQFENLNNSSATNESLDINQIETLNPARIHDRLRSELFLYNSAKNNYARPLAMENEPTPTAEAIRADAIELAAMTLHSDKLDGHTATIADDTGYDYPPNIGTTSLVLEAYDLLERDKEIASYAVKMLEEFKQSDKETAETMEAALARSLTQNTSFHDEIMKEYAAADADIELREHLAMQSSHVLYNDLSNPDYDPYGDTDDYTRLVKRSDMVFVPNQAEDHIQHVEAQEDAPSMAMNMDDLFEDENY